MEYIKLKSELGVQEFPMSQAENILKLQKRGKSGAKGWVIADPNYTFIDGKIIKNQSKRPDKSTEE